MKKYLEITFVIIIGLILGMVIHGLIEIPVIWILITWFTSFFTSISWGNWVLIHLIFTIFVEILGVFLALWIYKRKKATKI